MLNCVMIYSSFRIISVKFLLMLQEVAYKMLYLWIKIGNQDKKTFVTK